MRFQRDGILFLLVTFVLAGCSGSRHPTQVVQPGLQGTWGPGPGGDPGANPGGNPGSTPGNDPADVQALGDKLAGTIAAVTAGALRMGTLSIATDAATEVEDQADNAVPLSALAAGQLVVVELRKVNGNLLAREITRVTNAAALSPVSIAGRMSRVSGAQQTFEISGIRFHADGTSRFGDGLQGFADLRDGQRVHVRGRLLANGDLTVQKVSLEDDDDGDAGDDDDALSPPIGASCPR